MAEARLAVEAKQRDAWTREAVHTAYIVNRLTDLFNATRAAAGGEERLRPVELHQLNPYAERPRRRRNRIAQDAAFDALWASAADEDPL
jgi:hypothetical protein